MQKKVPDPFFSAFPVRFWSIFGFSGNPNLYVLLWYFEFSAFLGPLRDLRFHNSNCIVRRWLANHQNESALGVWVYSLATEVRHLACLCGRVACATAAAKDSAAHFHLSVDQVVPVLAVVWGVPRVPP